ncbi:blood group Rh(CE) polypeptide [Lissotriton helveticus]
MAPRYAPNIRRRLPWILLFTETVFIIIFLFLFTYDPSRSGNGSTVVYAAFQDINVMIFLGFGFLFAFLRRYGFSGIAFNLLIAAVGVQWAVIMDGLLFRFNNGIMSINLMSIVTASMSIASVLISAGVLLGKVNPVQLVFLTIFEVTAFSANRWVVTEFLKIESHVSMMYLFIFGAYFGLAIAWIQSRPIIGREIKRDKEKSEPISELFSMIGTLFLWMFFPTFNSMLIRNPAEKQNAVYNTYYALAVSAVTAFAMSAMTNEKGKLNMMHIRNATLAGGVAISFSASMINYPWIAMTLGLLAAMISMLGFKSMQTCLNSVFQVHDTCGVHATFGLPGLLGGIAHVILLLTAHWSGDFTALGYQALVEVGYHALVEVGAICFTLFLSIGGGLFTGISLKCKIWRPPQEWNYFDDQCYWEFPHLANKL